MMLWIDNLFTVIVTGVICGGGMFFLGKWFAQWQNKHDVSMEQMKKQDQETDPEMFAIKLSPMDVAAIKYHLVMAQRAAVAMQQQLQFLQALETLEKPSDQFYTDAARYLIDSTNEAWHNRKNDPLHE